MALSAGATGGIVDVEMGTCPAVFVCVGGSVAGEMPAVTGGCAIRVSGAAVAPVDAELAVDAG